MAKGRFPTTRKAGKANALSPAPKRSRFHLKMVIHVAEEGGYRAEVPALPGCVSEGETLHEVRANLREAIEGCLSVDVKDVCAGPGDRVEEIEL